MHESTTRLQTLLDAGGEFETPVAVVDGAVREANLRRMQALAGDRGLRLRPHAKTHKSTVVGRAQIAAGATGLTVATLQELEVFLDAGVDDLVLAHIPVGEPKLRRLRALAQRTRRLAVAVDSVAAAATLPESVEVLWEVDTGLHRLGTQPEKPTVDAVAALLESIRHERFRGLITHGGHAYASRDDAQLRSAAEDETARLVETRELLEAIGIAVQEISVGSTPTSRYWGEVTGASEIRPGTYIYGDANQVQLGVQSLEQCAFVVVATVISTPESNRAVVDAGTKALSIDLRVPGVESFGSVLGRPDLRLARMSEEHGVIVAGGAVGLELGDRVAIVPNHVCTAVNLHSQVLVVPESGPAAWEAVDARGWRTSYVEGARGGLGAPPARPPLRREG